MKTVVVTGGTTRLGLEISKYLRNLGWCVITTSHRVNSGADIIADLSKSDGAIKLYLSVIKRLGGNPPDALVNNASLFSGDSQSIKNVNFESPKKLISLMGSRDTPDRGFVVNIIDATSCIEGSSDYVKSKRELLEFTKDASKMFLNTINVNAVAPGPVLPPQGFSLKADNCPIGRPTPQAVAEAVSYFLSATFVTGQLISVDGAYNIEKSL